MSKRIKLNDQFIMLLIYVAFAAVSIFYGIHLSISLVIDETGTVANTAFLAGDDWSICVQTMGGFYYKYGVSALYVPLYLIFRNSPFLMYKAIMALHMAIISFIPVIAYYICRKHLKIDSQLKALLLAISGGGISSLWLYSLYSRSDMMLIFLPWLLGLILLELAEAAQNNKKAKRNLLTLALAFVSVYAYMCHSRGIVLLIATVLTIIAATFIYKNKIVNYLIYIPATAVFLVIDKFVSAYVKSGVYGTYGTRHASMESFDFEAFMKIFTPKGFIIELKLCIGWLFNLFTSSMGLVIIGAIACVVILFLGIKKKNMLLSENIFSLFALLCLLGTFAMGALFFFPHIYELMIGAELDRADRMIYGRYTVGAVGPICLIALYTLTCKKDQLIKLKTKICAVGIYIITLALFITKVSPSLENVPSTNVRYFLSISGFLNIINNKTSAAFPDLTEALLKAGIASLIVMIIIVLLTSFNKKKILFSTCIVVFVLSVINFNHIFWTVRASRDEHVAYRAKEVIYYIEDINGVDEISQKYPAIYKHESGYLPKSYQFALPKFNVGELTYISDTNQDEFMIICHKKSIEDAITNCDQILGDDNYYLFADFDYDNPIRDVIIVKGDELAEVLTKNGNKLIKYTK